MKTKCEKCGETENLRQNEVRDWCDGNGGSWEVDADKIDDSKPGWSATGVCPRCQDELAETETQDSDFEIAIKALARIRLTALDAKKQAVKLEEKLVFIRLARDIEKMRRDLIWRVYDIEDAEKLATHAVHMEKRCGNNETKQNNRGATGKTAKG